MILLLYILFLFSVAFLTLFERKILSLSQIRLGPNKMWTYGLIQPIIDGVKLMKKSFLSNINSHKFIFKMMSMLIFMFSMLSWTIIPYSYWSNKALVMLFIILMFGLMSYMVLMLGWSSMSNYGLIGGNRSLAQVLSFEMLISLLIFIIFIMKMSFNMMLENYSSFWLTITFFTIFIISIFLETHRAPMDMAEGESELVSGYNIEFGGIFFVLIFLSEYSSILFMLVLCFVMWFKLNFFMLILMMLLIMIIRSCFPRIRYDQIMTSLWLKILPFLTVLWFMFLNLKN